MSKRASSSNSKSSAKRKRLEGTATFHSTTTRTAFPHAFTLASPASFPSSSGSTALPPHGPFKASVGPGNPAFSWKAFGDSVKTSRARAECSGNMSGEVKREENAEEDIAILHSREKGKQKEVTKERKKKRSVQSRHPNIEWKQKYRHIFVDELMRWKGRADSRKQGRCSDCKGLDDDGKAGEERTPSYRCESCFMGDMVCKECCVKRHWDTPLHIVEKWDGSTFQAEPLRNMGLVVQLNHYRGFCAASKPAYDRLLILHTNGIHQVNVRFCGCSEAIPQYQQLLRRRLYPGNLRKGRIATAVTFEYLESLQVHTLTTKGSIYDFYRALEKMSNNTGEPLPASRYKQLLCIIRQWRHCKMIMRSGYGQSDCSGVDEAPEGAMTVRCPSCPHPGINMDDNWKQQGEEVCRFLCRLILCLDANFRLKEQMVSSHSRDPALCDGMGYFVRRKPFEEWIEANNFQNNPEDEISDCVPFAALSKQNTKFSKGLRYTGVGAAACGRTDMIVRIGNLNKGERYSVMDYIVGVALQQFMGLLWMILCYDIACQWFIKLEKRAPNWPEGARRPEGLEMEPAIGKLHEPGHKQKKHQKFSLNLIRWVGYTDGETLERIWGPHNILGNASKTMGPGGRQDLLEAQFDFWNWHKYITLGVALYRRWRAAVSEREKQEKAHEGLTKNLDGNIVNEWEGVVSKWEQAVHSKDEPTLLNPYEVKEEMMSQAQALAELEAEDEARQRRGKVSYHKMSAGAFVATSLEVIEAQEKLKQKVEEQKRDPTLRQSNKLFEQRRALKRRILALLDVRPVHMPGLLQYLWDRNLSDDHDDTFAESIKIWLPSSIPHVEVHRVCGAEVVDAETKLQFARANDSLDGLRHTLRVKTRMLLFKNTHVRGQRDSGRAREVINRVQLRAQLFVAQYRTARLAYLALAPEGTGMGELPKLENSDVRGLADPAKPKRGPGRRGTREDDLEYEVDEDVDEEVNEEEQEVVGGEGDEEGATRVRGTEGIDLIPADLTNYHYRTAHGTGETRKVNSWIWEYGRGRSKVGVDDGADNGNEILRAEWCKSRARFHRAQEEVALLQEEMKRALKFLDWAATRWEGMAEAHDNRVSGGLREGRRAYALKQARIQRRLRERFDMLWRVPLGKWDEAAVVKEEEEELSRLEGGDDPDEEQDEDEDEYGDE
ncbi:hypothetical protein V5O48_013793 [Marasmius crinis-equi]|uniref:CxC2-like cysteine cluster KDZ transposase-associated domain-containing protein n=1 Tax=Marasmius crinis-equi TaxID=585013 RepID=A0ABR3EZ41_9AGAR